MMCNRFHFKVARMPTMAMRVWALPHKAAKICIGRATYSTKHETDLIMTWVILDTRVIRGAVM